MSPPSPVLRRLYRHAATPARWLATLRQADTLIERFEFDLRRAGLDAEVALEPLLTPVSLAAALDHPLGSARRTGGAPATARSNLPDGFDTRPGRSDSSEPTAWLAERRLGGATVVAGSVSVASGAAIVPTWSMAAAAPAAPVTTRIDGPQTTAAAVGQPVAPPSHPRLAPLQMLTPLDLADLQRRYGLLDSAVSNTSAGAHTTTTADTTAAARSPTHTASGHGTLQHSAADAQHWLRALARRAHVAEALDQPLTLRAHLVASPADRTAPVAGSAAAQHPVLDRTPHVSAEPRDTDPTHDTHHTLDRVAAPPGDAQVQQLLQSLDPARAAAAHARPLPGATVAPRTAATTEPVRPARRFGSPGTTDRPDTRHPITAAAAATTAAALRAELYRHAAASDTPLDPLASPFGSPGRTEPGRSNTATGPTTGPATPPFSSPVTGQSHRAVGHPAGTGRQTSPAWSTPIGGFRGLAALGRAAEPGPATPSTEAAPPRQPFDASPDAPHDSVDAEQIAELLRQQARRHGIDLMEFEP